MLQRLFAAALNHLLDGEDWARTRLAPFAGRTVRIAVQLFEPVDLTIGIDARLTRAPTGTSPDVSFTLPADLPLRLLRNPDPEALIGAAHITGAADLAESFGFVLRHLRWDIESDLARIVGDIPATRIVRHGRQWLDWQARAAMNLARNVAEYLSEEQAALVPRREQTRFADSVSASVQQIQGLEQRIIALESSATTK